MAERSATPPVQGGIRDAIVSAVTIWVTMQLTGFDNELAEQAGLAAGETVQAMIAAFSGVAIGLLSLARKYAMDRLTRA